MIKRAIVSVYDKDGIVQFCKNLQKFGIEIISTGQTYKLLKANNIDAIEVSELTGFPEILDGRVKTLHPKIFGGILAKKEPCHLKEIEKHNISPIELVVVNLYPFEEICKQSKEHNTIIENIDIGGVALLRAAAKNYKYITVLCNKNQYNEFIERLEQNTIDEQINLRYAKEVFAYTSRYDSIIYTYFASFDKKLFEPNLNITLEKVNELSYGENPHQQACLYQFNKAEKFFTQISGKALSYNNLLDLDTAFNLITELKKYFAFKSSVIIKHNNPCGASLSDTVNDAFIKAYQTDTVSAYGGIIGISDTVDKDTALNITNSFFEMVAAYDFTDDALKILTDKKNLRIIKFLQKPTNCYELRSIFAGVLVQTPDERLFEKFEYVAGDKLPLEVEEDLKFGMIIAKYVKSNAIVYVRQKQVIGIGAGQMSRIDAAELGIKKAEKSGFTLQDSIMASDAFFPFPDIIELANKYKIKAIIQPGGSVRDELIIKKAREYNIPLVFTGCRHFKH